MEGTGRRLPGTPWALPDAAAAPAGEELLGAGADLEPGTLLAAYATGLFPMPLGESGGPLRRRRPARVGWWSPDPRGVLPLDGLRVTRSLRRAVGRFTVTVDESFDEVVEGCADPARTGAWISAEVRAAYLRLHELGWAHSVEVRDGSGALAGGLYGVEIGGLFAGESMFHRATDASKVALVALVERLRAGEDPHRRLLDVQWRTQHLATLGVVEVPRPVYLQRLAAALTLAPVF